MPQTDTSNQNKFRYTCIKATTLTHPVRSHCPSHWYSETKHSPLNQDHSIEAQISDPLSFFTLKLRIKVQPATPGLKSQSLHLRAGLFVSSTDNTYQSTARYFCIELAMLKLPVCSHHLWYWYSVLERKPTTSRSCCHVIIFHLSRNAYHTDNTYPSKFLSL